MDYLKTIALQITVEPHCQQQKMFSMDCSFSQCNFFLGVLKFLRKFSLDLRIPVLVYTLHGVRTFNRGTVKRGHIIVRILNRVALNRGHIIAYNTILKFS